MVCNKLFTAFQDFRFVSSEESIHLHPYNSVSCLILYLKIKLCRFLHLAIHPKDICLIFQEITILRKHLKSLIKKTFCFDPVLSRILHQEPALKFHKSRMSRIFLQKVADDLLCFLHPVKLIVIRCFPEKLNTFLQFLHIRAQMIPLLTDLQHSICL